MAIFAAIPEKTQTATAMKRVLDYVMQDKKTELDGVKLVSGQHCVPEFAYQEFMATKNEYGKASGIFFKQYVQSFKPDCGATPELIRQIGIEMAKAFEGFEVVIATHIDRDHWHNHFVVNSVNCETGLKIQIDEKGLEQLRQRSDEICQQFGFEILKPYEKPKQKTISQREYRTALRGESKKLKLANAIDYAVAHSRSKQQFIAQMEKLGYGVKWIDHYRYITYTTPEGQRFRDNRLLEEKYLKANMEGLFAYGQQETKAIESNHHRNSEDINGADTAAVPAADSGTVQQGSPILQRSWEQHCRDHGFNVLSDNTSGYGEHAKNNNPSGTHKNAGVGNEQSGLDEVFRRGQVIEADGVFEQNTGYETVPVSGRTTSQGSDTVETEAEVGIDWGNLAADGLYLAADLAMIIEEDKDNEQKPKHVHERKHGQKKKKPDQSNTGHGFGMKM